MPGREILQFAEYIIAMFPVEPRCLKTERIQIGSLGPSFPGFLFGSHEETVPVSMTTQIFFHKQQFYVEPIPVGLANQASHEFPIGAAQDEA